MGAWIELRKNETGEIRRHRDDYFESSPDRESDYIWTEGNYACDCNRALFFARAHNEPDPDVECGDAAYAAIRAICDDGTIIMLDDDSGSET